MIPPGAPSRRGHRALTWAEVVAARKDRSRAQGAPKKMAGGVKSTCPPCSAPSDMKDRSSIRLVRCDIDFKIWMDEVPSVDEVRPASCPCCGRASREPGRGLGLHGHGQRDRQLRGPLECWGPPQIVVITARRYRCQHCSAVIFVVPRGVMRGRLFSAAAIAWALWLFGMQGLPPSRVRAAVSPWQTAGATAAAGWAQLRRWVRDVRQGRLFGGLPSAAGGGGRAIAERITTALRATAPPSAWDASPEGQLWQGALHARVGITG